MLRHIASFCVLVLAAAPVRAAPIDDLFDALRVSDTIVVMREEGVSQGDDMARDMLGGPTPG